VTAGWLASRAADRAGREIIRWPWTKPRLKVPAPQASGVAARLCPPPLVRAGNGGGWSQRNHCQQAFHVVTVHHSPGSLAGFRKTGLLAANAFLATAWGAMEYFCDFFADGRFAIGERVPARRIGPHTRRPTGRPVGPSKKTERQKHKSHAPRKSSGSRSSPP